MMANNGPLSPASGSQTVPKARRKSVVEFVQKAIQQVNPSRSTPKQPTPTLYLDRISIGGLHDYLYADGKRERRIWLLILLLATAGTLVYLVRAFREYLEFTTVLDICHQTEPALRIPNPYVCVWGTNFSYFEFKLKNALPLAYEDKRLIFLADRIGRLLKKRNPSYWVNRTYDASTFLTNTIEYMIVGPTGDAQWVDDIHHEFLDEAIAKATSYMGSDYTGLREFFEKGMFDCRSVLKNCSLNGIPIDCCRDSASGMLVVNSKCFKIDVRKELEKRNIDPTGPISLSFETIIDGAHTPSNDIMYKGPMEITLGLQDHVGGPGGGISAGNDVTLGAGTDTMISLRGKFKRRLFSCIEKYQYKPSLHEGVHHLIQEHFKNFTLPNRYNIEECTGAKLLEKLSIQCGCVGYFKDVRPEEEDICSPGQIYACMHAAMEKSDEDKHKSTGSDTGAKSIRERIDVFHKLKLAVDEECLQLCESWTYEPTVWSMIAEGEAGNVSRYYRNKVTITFDHEYIVEEEVLKNGYPRIPGVFGRRSRFDFRHVVRDFRRDRLLGH